MIEQFLPTSPAPLGYGADSGSKDFIQRLTWGTDAGCYRLIPEEVFHPADEGEVRKLLSYARREGKHITFRAAGTSLSGQALSDSLLVVVGKRWENYAVLDGGKRICMQPGLTGGRVNEILAPYGTYFTPDPASLKSAMVGGIVNNNASGMSCGTHANSYRMLDSVRILLADGTLLDTSDSGSKEAFRLSHREFLEKIELLRDRTRANAALSELIRRKYAIKNVTGLTILPFVEYDDPFDIIAHLIVGSEGTLAFLSEVVMRTAPVPGYSASALMLFATTEMACQAVIRLNRTNAVAAAEFFDRKAMAVLEDSFPELKGRPADASAVLVRVEDCSEREMERKIEQVEKALEGIEAEGKQFTTDKELVAKYWAMRSGIFPAVGATRRVGTTCLIEDIAFPIEHLAEATADLQALFKEHRYPDAVIYGHALEGNYHFILNQCFNTQESIAQYDSMMRAVVSLVVDKYHGSLKAEHGTGRNMAPFVRKEWGDDAYELMCEVKRLFDPDNILNPGVIFNEDSESYLRYLKPLPSVHPMVDKCIECGFCEVNCVSCGFALSSRGRIIVQREIARLLSEGERGEAHRLQRAFRHIGKDLCAGDGLCSTSCPIGINVGEYIHLIRERELSATGRAAGRFAAHHFAAVGGSVSSILLIAGFAQKVLGDKWMLKVCKGLRYASGKTMPLWTPSMPHRTCSGKIVQSASVHTDKSLKVVYFPSCLNQRMGLAEGDPSEQPTMGDMVELLHKAGYDVLFPKDMKRLCCGMIWESKGMADVADEKAFELEQALREASRDGQYPVLCDQSPCLYRMRRTMKGMQLYEPAEFIERFLLSKLDITPMEEPIMLHITCSMRKMGLGETILRVARQCAREVIVPSGIGCCGFAGDKGFTEPELNDWALRHLREQCEEVHATVGISNSRTCEIGLSSHAGVPYINIAWLVNKVSKRRK